MSLSLMILSILCLTNTIHDEIDSSWKLRIPPTSNGNFINSGTPQNISLSFDCAVRKYAYEYGQQIQPRHGNLVELFDSLQLAACNITRPDPQPKTLQIYKPFTSISANCVFYINPLAGSDSNNGTINNPFKTIIQGILATRSIRKKNKLFSPCASMSCTLNLMQGIYYQNDTIVLTSNDSYLTFQNYNGQHAIISGGIPLQFNDNWKLEKYSPIRWINYTNYNNAYKIASVNESNDQAKYLDKVGTYDECLALALSSPMNPFYSITWYNVNFSEEFAGHCYGIKDIHWAPVVQNNVISGHLEGRNVWSTKVKNYNDLLDGTITGLRVNQRRVIRARYPNQNPEISMQYAPLSGYIMYPTKWKPPKIVPNAQDIIETAANWSGVIWPMQGPGGTPWTGDGCWGEFFQGKGGPCVLLQPDYGYWCSHDAPRNITQHESPSGVTINPISVINSPYNDVSDAIVHAWRPAHWFTWMWSVETYDATSGNISFADGGFQGGEGATSGAEWYIENVFEELDSPGEYFYNRSTKTLYFYYNVTTQTAPPQDTEFVATKVKILFNITGSQQEPVVNISFRGLEFVDTPYTYMDKHGLPSGGDWALQRQGAILFQGTENCWIDHCYFTRLDGIGVFLSGYNRNTTIEYCDFSWIGDSAMAAWGYTSGLESILPGGGPDGRDGDQPRFTYIRNNLAHDVGIWEKQSSMWFQAQSTQTRFINNIFFNGPRAAVNVNDGFGGDNHLFGNLLVNTCRESGDHGPYNSWDRVPYITRLGNGSSSIIPAFQHIARNFIFGTYQTLLGVDTDDGSCYYKIYDNYMVYGTLGLKSNFGGHNVLHTDNVYAYIQNAWRLAWTSGANDQFINNSVILTDVSGYNSNCNLPKGTDGFVTQNNTIYNSAGKINGNDKVCGMTFAQWQAKGNDPYTSFHTIPSDSEIILMGKAKLQNN